MAPSVLVVEDEANIELSLRFLLEKAGFTVRSVGDGEAALSEMRRRRPDIVLLDIMLPTRDGYSVCREIRAEAGWRDVRVMMLSARGRDCDREEGMAAGADVYITKPFSTRDLVREVEALAGRPAS